MPCGRARACLRDAWYESAVLLARNGDGFQRTVAVSAIVPPSLVIAADGYLAGRLAAFSDPLPFEQGELKALGAWAAASSPSAATKSSILADADVRLAVALRTRNDIVGVAAVWRA